MRQKQHAIADILKKWTKSREASRMAECMAAAEKLADNAKDEVRDVYFSSVSYSGVILLFSPLGIHCCQCRLRG